ncbi:MAG: RluA family pseudouridine synthase [Kiritimatiellia bacterium]
MKSKILNTVALIVSKTEEGAKLQDFLVKKLGLSRRAAKQLLDDKSVWVNRRCIWMTHHEVHKGDTIEVPALHTAKKQESVKLKVLVDYADFLIIDKPSGMVVVGKVSVESKLQEQLGNANLRVVHRLDKETTGCLLCAKSARSFDAAVAVFKTRRVIKIYQAIVYGKFERNTALLDQELDGARAVSQVRRMACSKDASFLKIRIETGRTHQIRRHLAAVRHPVLGDKQYGVKFARDPRLVTVARTMLHSSEIELTNPLGSTGTIKAHSPLPADFRRCLKLFDMGR